MFLQNKSFLHTPKLELLMQSYITNIQRLIYNYKLSLLVGIWWQYEEVAAPSEGFQVPWGLKMECEID